MGCYRYQDVKTVPFEGLICLLWDVPEDQQTSVVESLSKSSLIEFKGEYYLHCAVQEAAKLRLLENTTDWETANIKAAKLWENNIKTGDGSLKASKVEKHITTIFSKSDSRFDLNSWDDSSISNGDQLSNVFNIVKAKLQQTVANSDLFSHFFDDKANTTELQTVRYQCSIGDFRQLPPTQTISTENMNNTLSRYADLNKTVYLSEVIFLLVSTSDDSAIDPVGILFEQTFNWLEDLLPVIKDNKGKSSAKPMFCMIIIDSDLTHIKEKDNRVFSTINGYLNSIINFSTTHTAKIFQQYLNHSNLTDKNAAIGELAKSYFQIALTYKTIGNYNQAEEYKEKALDLFAQIVAPKQIDRVNEAFEQGAIK
jgi:tetratricopeptide (TPR) repeat protein